MSKATSYSAELVTAITSQYLAGVELKVIAEKAGRTIPMIRSKLVSEGVYIPKAKVKAVAGETPVRKLAIAQMIGAKLDLATSVESLEKASKAELEAVLTAVTELSEIVAFYESESVEPQEEIEETE